MKQKPTFTLMFYRLGQHQYYDPSSSDVELDVRADCADDACLFGNAIAEVSGLTLSRAIPKVEHDKG